MSPLCRCSCLNYTLVVVVSICWCSLVRLLIWRSSLWDPWLPCFSLWVVSPVLCLPLCILVSIQWWSLFPPANSGSWFGNWLVVVVSCIAIHQDSLCLYPISCTRSTAQGDWNELNHTLGLVAYWVPSINFKGEHDQQLNTEVNLYPQSYHRLIVHSLLIKFSW